MTESDQRNIYESGSGLPEAELERLKHTDFEHPFYVTASLLKDENLSGKSLLDIGSGADSKLGELVSGRGGKYVALDVNEKLLGSLKAQLTDSHPDFSGLFILGDALHLPIRSADSDGKGDNVAFVHQRFVLMHLSPEDRRKEIISAVAAAKETALFLEYDWTTLASETHPELVASFKETSLRLMAALPAKIEPFMGQKLESEVQTALGEDMGNYKIQNQRFSRKGMHAKEILALANMQAALSKARVADPEQAAGFSQQFAELAKQISANLDTLELTPADICATTVAKI